MCAMAGLGVEMVAVMDAGVEGAAGREEVLDLAGVATERIEAELTKLAGHLAAAECRWVFSSASSIAAGVGRTGGAGRVRTGSTGSAACPTAQHVTEPVSRTRSKRCRWSPLGTGVHVQAWPAPADDLDPGDHDLAPEPAYRLEQLADAHAAPSTLADLDSQAT